MKQDLAADIAEIKKGLLTAKNVLTPPEAAQYMGISLSTLYKYTHRGVLPFSKPNGKLIFFSREKLDEWLLSRPSVSQEQREREAATYVTLNSKR